MSSLVTPSEANVGRSSRLRETRCTTVSIAREHSSTGEASFEVETLQGRLPNQRPTAPHFRRSTPRAMTPRLAFPAVNPTVPRHHGWHRTVVNPAWYSEVRVNGKGSDCQNNAPPHCKKRTPHVCALQERPYDLNLTDAVGRCCRSARRTVGLNRRPFAQLFRTLLTPRRRSTPLLL